MTTRRDSSYRYLPLLLGALLTLLWTGCKEPPPEETHPRPETTATPPPPSTPVFGWEVIAEYPHDTTAYTQGLEIHDGALYESTGLFGGSSLRQVDLKTGRVLRKIGIDSQYFAEGMTIHGGKLFQLTWQNRVGFVYNPTTFSRIDTFGYQGQGWGLTNDGQRLIMSDGTNVIRFLDTATQAEIGRISVFDGIRPVDQLNELEYIDGEIYANVYQTTLIVRIDPASGRVIGWINLKGILPVMEHHPDGVLNGIAYDARGKHLYNTGKRWPRLFEIRLKTPLASLPASKGGTASFSSSPDGADHL